MSKIGVVRIRGITGIKKDIKDTMTMLNIHRKNHCVVLDKTPSTLGMIFKVKDYITWGDINEETLTLLKKKSEGNKFFRLNPPLKGYGRKGIKVSFTRGGGLGDRKEKINDLIRRML